MSPVSIVLLVGLVLVVFLLISIYNKLVGFKNRYQNAFAQIEVQLKRRYDLIPNLVETAKAYLAHERETLEAVIAARNQAMAGLKAAAGQVNGQGGGQAMQQLAGSEGALASALGRLNVVMEAYPDLKANQNMMQLTEEITSSENKVAFARQGYNDSVTSYNTYRQSFPAILVASSFGHANNAEFLMFADSAQIQSAPTVKF
ncbi:MAG: hypothetical protein RL217_246 [Pseudomonadota bacterium]|jgi:LemA protein